MLDLRFGSLADAGRDRDRARLTRGLLPFQQHAVERADALLARRGGAILADSVGLGKTHVAAALVRVAIDDGRAVLVTAPAPLAAHWRRHLPAAGWTWRSHTSLSRGAAVPAHGAGRGLVVVDEAHAFRNPATRRYGALAAACAHADVLLITATPVNNTIFDAYHLVRLFARDGDFADIGVPDMFAAFDRAAAGADTEGVSRIIEEVCIRRTREFVRAQYGGSLAIAAGRLRFPRVGAVTSIRYGAPATLNARALDAIAALRFPAHTVRGEPVAVELMRLSLLKRLESSTAAFVTSIERQLALLDRFLRAAAEGLLFDASDHRAFRHGTDRTVQLVLDAVALRPWPETADVAAATQAAQRESHLLRALRASAVGAGNDRKLETLRSLVTDTLAAEKVLVFSEYRDTAVHVWRSLASIGGVALVHGGEARLGLETSSRTAVVRRFAPAASGARAPREHERVRVLVATDVLAEGLNLQDARAVVSYDMPWNPMRLAQRIGRIDRLGSPHDEVLTYSFLPDRCVDEYLGLLRRIRRKLRHARIVGGDAPRLHSARREAEHAVRAVDAGRDTLELLRVQHRAGATRGGPRTEHGAVLAAALPHLDDGPYPAALCCVTTGGAARFIVVRGAHPDAVSPGAVDAVLLAALDADAVLAPDMAVCTRAGRVACHAARRHIAAAAPAAVRGAERWAASAIHRWLRLRPGGAAPSDCALADDLLRRLATGLSFHAQRQVGRIAAAGADAAGTIAALRDVLASAGAPAPSTTPRVRLRAVLQLLPRPAARPG